MESIYQQNAAALSLSLSLSHSLSLSLSIMINTETMLKCSAERLQGIHLTWLGLCQQTTTSLYSSDLDFCTEYSKEENKAQTKKRLVEWLKELL